MVGRSMFRAVALAVMVALVPWAAGAGGFGDVGSEHPQIEAIEFVSQLGIMRGYGDGVFGPDDYFTREQLATVVVRILGLESLTEAVKGVRADMYVDAHEDPEHWSQPYLTVAYEKGLMVGERVGDARQFHPGDATTFNEVCTILIRALLGTRLEVWPDDYHAVLAEMGFLTEDQIRALGPAKANRAEIALLVHYALTETDEGRELAENLQRAARVFEWTFDEDKEGWTGDFTDLPVDYEEDIYELAFGHSVLPSEVGEGKALMLSGINRSDDLFMYVKKQLTAANGIQPDTTYLIRFEVEFATDAPAGAVGVGGPPGEAVWVKVGAAPVEPVPVEVMVADVPYYTLSVDKGWQNEDGENALRIGDVAKVECDEFDVYELKTLDNEAEPLRMESDQDGNLWIFVGTDSGFEGRTTLYYNRIKVTLEIED